MKTLAAVILALGIGLAAGYFVRPRPAPVPPAPAPPTAAPAPAPAPMEKIVSTPPPAPAPESPHDILNDLLNVKLDAGAGRNAALRIVVYRLEMLAHCGPAAVPAIRDFLSRNVDVDYESQETAQASADNAADNAAVARRGRAARGGAPGQRGQARRARNIDNLRTDWVAPPSLRLGLVGTLKEIGGPSAEVALAEMLASTGRGVEVAYLAITLDEMAPGKYRDQAIKAARELLMNPPSMDDPDRLDQLAKSYLYGVLEHYQDDSFAINAQQLLVGPNGRLDPDAMDYLSAVLKDQAVNALCAAYQNSSLSNAADRLTLSREIIGYVGRNNQANQVMTDTLNNPDLPPQMKAGAILQLAGGGFGPFASDVPDASIAAARVTYLNSIAQTYANDPALSQAIALAAQALQNGTTVTPEDMRSVFGRGGRGDPAAGGGN